MENVKQWLSKIGDNFNILYADDFARDGWDDLEFIHLMTEADVKSIIQKPGHTARVWAAIQKAKACHDHQRNSSSTTTCASAESIKTTKNTTTFSQKRLPFFDGDQSVIPDEKPWKRLNVWYPYPKQNRCHYSNQSLPAMYKAAFPSLQSKFTNYFSFEVANRYDRKLKIDKWEKFVSFKLSSQNEASYSKLIHFPSKPKREHIKQCKTAIKELQSKETEISEELRKICVSYNSLFDEAGLTPHKWASEQIKYESEIKIILEGMVLKLTEGIKQIEITERRLKSMYPNMQTTASANKRRRTKEGKRKAKKRKSERLDKNSLLFLRTITSNDTVDLCFPEEARTPGHLQISQHYVTASEINTEEFETCLKKQRSNDALKRLLELEVFSVDSRILIEQYCHIDTSSESE